MIIKCIQHSWPPKLTLSAQIGVEVQRWGTVGLCFSTCADEIWLWLFGSALVWLSCLSTPKTASLRVSSCLRRSQQRCQHLKQRMLSLWPSATEHDGEKEGLECEVLLSVLWICLYIMLMTLDLSLSHHSLETRWDDWSSGGLHKRKWDLRSSAEVREDA